MSSTPTLNSFAPYGQVLMVRAKPWKAHSYDPETGALSEEWIRGLCAVFAKGSGEGVSLTPMLHFLRNALEAGQDDGPAFDPVAWNNRAHFAALVWAARNKVRHSVRWKTGARVRRVRKLEALRRVRATARLIQRRAEGRTGLQGRPADRTAKGRRAAHREWRNEARIDALAHAYPSDNPEEQVCGASYDALRDMAQALSRGDLPDWVMKCRETVDRFGEVKQVASSFEMLWKFSLLTGDGKTGQQLIQWAKSQIEQIRCAFAHLLRFLQASAYRAHLTRRVKPPVRRTRVRRPLYARPRPPSAPLAPPVI